MLIHVLRAALAQYDSAGNLTYFQQKKDLAQSHAQLMLIILPIKAFLLGLI